MFLYFVTSITLFFACDPDLLDIPYPKQGETSFQQEDLRRAVWTMEKQQSTPNIDALHTWWKERARTLHLKDDSSSCYTHTSNSPNAENVVFFLQETTPVSLAVLASLAKATDNPDITENWWYCLDKPKHIQRNLIGICDITGTDLVWTGECWNSTTHTGTNFVSLHFQRLLENSLFVFQQASANKNK